MKWVSGMYFKSAGEADEWLDFECSDMELENKFYAENDRFHEWVMWRDWFMKQYA